MAPTNSISHIIKENKAFLIPWILVSIPLAIVTSIYTKAEIHIFLNRFHSGFGDAVMPYLTYLGDGISSALLIIVFLFVKYRYAIALAAGNLLSLVLVHFFKKIVFKGTPRPVKYFTEFYNGNFDLYIVPGTHPGSMHSFPSGHTTTAFFIFFFIALTVKNKSLKALLFIAAAITAYTRVYLSWHFLHDIIAGSLLGIIIATVSWWIGSQFKKEWADASLIRKTSQKKYVNE